MVSHLCKAPQLYNIEAGTCLLLLQKPRRARHPNLPEVSLLPPWRRKRTHLGFLEWDKGKEIRNEAWLQIPLHGGDHVSQFCSRQRAGQRRGLAATSQLSQVENSRCPK